MNPSTDHEDLEDLDARAHAAVRAARASVAAIDHAAAVRALERESGPGRGRPQQILHAAAMAAAVVIVGIVALAVNRTAEHADVATTATPSSSAARPADAGQAGPSGPPLASGASQEGRKWTLSLGAATDDLCLWVRLPPNDATGGQEVCADGGQVGPRAPGPGRYRPSIFEDQRTPRFVFGLLPPQVKTVDLITFASEPLVGSAAIPGPRVAAYVLEVPTGTSPDVVVGRQADGRSVRYSPFCSQAPQAAFPMGLLGSEPHFVALSGLFAVAPAALRDDLHSLRTYVQMAVRPGDARMQLIENWPAEQRASNERVQRFIGDHCNSDGSPRG